jgi:hypothetical protein
MTEIYVFFESSKIINEYEIQKGKEEYSLKSEKQSRIAARATARGSLLPEMRESPCSLSIPPLSTICAYTLISELASFLLA